MWSWLLYTCGGSQLQRVAIERRRVVASQPPIATWLRCNDRGTCVQQVSSKWAVSRCAMSAGFWARVSFRGLGQGYGSGSG